MGNLDHWRLCDVLPVEQAALLYAGIEPARNDLRDNNFSDPQFNPSYPTYMAGRTLIINAVLSGILPATIRYGVLTPDGWADESEMYNPDSSVILKDDRNIKVIVSREPDWMKTTIQVDDLKKWLGGKGVTSGFFFPNVTTDAPDYLNSDHPNYSPKLAAAVAAWKAVTNNPALAKGTSVKQGLVKWLRMNAASFDLAKDGGNPNEQGIDEIAKIANWDTKGGAPKTPGG
ncbi:MAG: hypothetical protein HQL51_05830 [Magnetococcales bacterium]|nr:hypothetical protein [Magnetococcales bacterium]